MRSLKRSPAPKGSGGGEGAIWRNERGTGDDACEEDGEGGDASDATASPRARLRPRVRGSFTAAPAPGDGGPSPWAGRRSDRRRRYAPPAPAPCRRGPPPAPRRARRAAGRRPCLDLTRLPRNSTSPPRALRRQRERK